jgi:uncharacterized protein YbjT (DUF2867 family)
MKVLVVGATGQQGSLLVRELVTRGDAVRALTRRPESERARTLADSGVELVRGDLEDAASLADAVRGVDALYLVATPFEAGEAAETRQALNAVEAARAAGVGHVVYSSVANADRRTGIPHFESKARVEERLRELKVPHTIVAPVYFMENLLGPRNLEGLRAGVLAMALPAGRVLQQVALRDLARFGALVLGRREEFLGERIDIASDELTGERMARLVGEAAHRAVRYEELPIEQVRAFSEDFALMLEWFDRVGYSADIEGLRRSYPEVGWQRYDEWARGVDWGALLGGPAAS